MKSHVASIFSPLDVHIEGLSVLLVAAVGLSACATNPAVKDQQKEELQSAVEDFHRALEWEMIDKAAKWVSPEFEQRFRGRYEEYGDDLDIVGVKIESVDLEQRSRGAQGGSTSALVEVRQRWYVEPDMSVDERHYVERWTFQNNGWKITDRIRRDQWRERHENEGQSEANASVDEESVDEESADDSTSSDD